MSPYLTEMAVDLTSPGHAASRASLNGRPSRGKAGTVLATGGRQTNWHSPNLQSQIVQTRVTIWPAPRRPAKLAIICTDGKVIDRGVACRHQPFGVELPGLVAEAAGSLAVCCIVPS